jgi:hypothetical protein
MTFQDVGGISITGGNNTHTDAFKTTQTINNDMVPIATLEPGFQWDVSQTCPFGYTDELGFKSWQSKLRQPRAPDAGDGPTFTREFQLEKAQNVGNLHLYGY